VYKIIITILLLIYSFIAHCQDVTDSIQRFHKNINEIKELKNSLYIKGQNLGNNFYVHYYLDTINQKRKIVYIKEISNNGKTDYYVKDILSIISIDKGQYIEFGSMDLGHLYNFVIAIEEDYKDFNLSHPINSNKIYKAWIINPVNEKFENLDTNGLYRINEGYYRKNASR
jgi:hypothetical protein